MMLESKEWEDQCKVLDIMIRDLHFIHINGEFLKGRGMSVSDVQFKGHSKNSIKNTFDRKGNSS